MVALEELGSFEEPGDAKQAASSEYCHQQVALSTTIDVLFN